MPVYTFEVAKADFSSRDQSVTATILRNLSREHRNYRISSENRLEELKNEILDAVERVHHNIEKLDCSINEAAQSEKSSWHAELPSSATQQEDQQSLVLGEAVSKNLSNLFKDKQRLISERDVLSSLHFEQIETRLALIATAHHKSFDWLLTNQWSERPSHPQYLEWLEQHDGIFWIAGKAGSGKSTLMKYLCKSPQVHQAVGKWAGENQVVCASYFFWNAGSELQKSQEGLLRSLLYEILRKCPKLMPKVMPLQWPIRAKNLWSQEEFFNAFSLLGQQQITSTRFCFFIDGLDEYAGSHPDIVNTLSCLSKSSAIKICLSSRPYNIFKEAYGQFSERMLTLQAFNAADMDAYIKDTLEKDVRFVRLKGQDPRYQDLVDEIRQKAQGVFLWVVLVIKSLRQGLVNADSLPFLQQRVRSFPADLEQFYAHILQNIEPIYHEQMAKSLKIALTLSEPSPVLTYSYLDEEDISFGVNIPLQGYCATEVLNRCTSMGPQLNARCADFLEVFYDKPHNPICTYKVDFLHRTARDFFLNPKMQSLLDAKLCKPFCVEKYLCSAFLAQAKLVVSMLPNFEGDFSNRDYSHYSSIRELTNLLKHLISKILGLAYNIEKQFGILEDVILDELECIILYRKTSEYPKGPEFEYRKAMELGSVEERGYILGEAIRNGLSLYVMKKLDRDVNFRTLVYGRPPLHWVLLDPNPDIETVKVLLDRGASPNQASDKGTPWSELLLKIRRTGEAMPNKTKAYWINVMEAMIVAGAEPNPPFFKDGQASALITLFCSPDDGPRLIDQLQRNGKKATSQPANNGFNTGRSWLSGTWFGRFESSF